MNESTSLADLLRQRSESADATRSAIDEQIRHATAQMLNAALPLDVHHRYASIKSAETAVIERLGQEVRRTLKNAHVGPDVLSGKVAEKVKQGIADLTAHTDYTAAVKSIS